MSADAAAPPAAPTGVDPLQRLSALRSAGQLEANAAELPALLAGLDRGSWPAASRLFAAFDAERAPAELSSRVARVAVLGSGTVRGIAGPLAAQLSRHALVPQLAFGGFGQWAIELLTPGHELFADSPDLALLLLDSSVVTGRLPQPWTAADVGGALSGALADIRAAVAAAPCALAVTTIAPSAETLGLLVDSRSRMRVAAAWRRFNADLIDVVAESPRGSIIDVDAILTQTGPLRDDRMALYAGVELGEEVIAEIARAAGHLVRASRGMTRKALALDLDGTVWGGILADDGPEGLATGAGPKGKAHARFQDAARQLASQGVLLTALSKNDEPAVRAVLANDPHLHLREADLVSLVANWEPKPLGLATLAERLNIGTDAFVFVDDSESERGLMAASRPEVAVVAVDAREPALHVAELLRDSWFLTAAVTADDLARPGRYREQAQRAEAQAAAGNVDEYLASLRTEVDIRGAGPADYARVAQITQRTNQFNLTTLRMDEAAVAEWAQDPQRLALAVRCRDRFGDHGLVGAVFVEYAGAQAHVRNFALSCRVLARGVETAVLGAVVEAARGRGCREVAGWYAPSPKNRRVAALYSEHGFTENPETAGRFDIAVTEARMRAQHVRATYREKA
jgi:FkbH-like protein